jgi:hypothetical protein
MHSVRFSLIGYALFAASSLSAGVLVAGTNPDSSGLDSVSDSPGPEGVFSLEQLFTLSSAADVTSLEINAASFSAQTLRIQLYRGLGLEGTGTLLKTFNISIPGTYDGLPLDIPTIMVSTALSLGSGNYSLLFTDPNPSPDLIYLSAALSSNTPDGSLGGTNWSTGITGGGNLVFELDGTVAGSTPEPGVLWLTGIGLFAVGVRSRVVRLGRACPPCVTGGSLTRYPATIRSLVRLATNGTPWALMPARFFSPSVRTLPTRVTF